jgi:DtxR family transcriptional regulator, Mn-dependent transcriptional regulator
VDKAHVSIFSVRKGLILDKHDDLILTPGLEDYLEAIFMIEQKKNVSRVKDIASRLNVRAASVTGALQSLSEKKLINYTPYEYITLTESGKYEAKKVVRRHKFLKQFFIEILGIDEDIADEGACNVEHTIPKVIMERMVDFMDFVKKNELSAVFDRFKNQ